MRTNGVFAAMTGKEERERMREGEGVSISLEEGGRGGKRVVFAASGRNVCCSCWVLL